MASAEKSRACIDSGKASHRGEMELNSQLDHHQKHSSSSVSLSMNCNMQAATPLLPFQHFKALSSRDEGALQGKAQVETWSKLSFLKEKGGGSFGSRDCNKQEILQSTGSVEGSHNFEIRRASSAVERVTSCKPRPCTPCPELDAEFARSASSNCP